MARGKQVVEEACPGAGCWCSKVPSPWTAKERRACPVPGCTAAQVLNWSDWLAHVRTVHSNQALDRVRVECLRNVQGKPRALPRGQTSKRTLYRCSKCGLPYANMALSQSCEVSPGEEQEQRKNSNPRPPTQGVAPGRPRHAPSLLSPEVLTTLDKIPWSVMVDTRPLLDPPWVGSRARGVLDSLLAQTAALLPAGDMQVSGAAERPQHGQEEADEEQLQAEQQKLKTQRDRAWKFFHLVPRYVLRPPGKEMGTCRPRDVIRTRLGWHGTDVAYMFAQCVALFAD